MATENHEENTHRDDFFKKVERKLETVQRHEVNGLVTKTETRLSLESRDPNFLKLSNRLFFVVLPSSEPEPFCKKPSL